MKILVYALVACIAGCTSDRDDLPVVVGGGGGSLVAPGTAVTHGGLPILIGRVCLIADPRVLDGCAVTGAGGFVVALGTSSAVTTSDGTFQIVQPVTPVPAFSVTGVGIVPATQPVAVVNTIPVMTADLFGQVLAANGITLTQGSGTILASVVDRGGNPVTGATATSTPSPAFGPFFDGTTPTAWTLNGTGARGVVLFPGVVAGPATATFDLGSSGESTVDGIQVVDGGITIVDAVLP
jgi:hypothetical protein